MGATRPTDWIGIALLDEYIFLWKCLNDASIVKLCYVLFRQGTNNFLIIEIEESKRVQRYDLLYESFNLNALNSN